MADRAPANPPLFAALGQRLRELRLDRGHSQAELARRLGISPAYLNLIEKGRRTVQLPLLWKALDLLGVEPEPFMSSLGERPVEESLAALLDEPLLRSLDLDAQDLSSLGAEPRAATTIATLFSLYKNTRSQLESVLEALGRREAGRKPSLGPAGEPGEPVPRLDYSPLDEVADFLELRKNFFPSLEHASAKVRADAGLDRRVLSDELVRVLSERLDVDVQLTDAARGSSVVRRFDPERGTLEMSRELGEARKKFDLAHVIGLRVLKDQSLIDPIVAGWRPKHPETPKLVKIHLANYFAGALLLPYADFFAEAQRTRWDVERLASLFETSYEAAAHRLTNLSDPRRRGVPMHFLRVDVGGNISKRYSATGLRFPTHLGSCPKWAVHTAFLTPSVLARQFSVMPDGSAYFCFAKVTATPVQGSLAKGTVYSIGLGTRAEDAHHVAYSDELPRWAPESARKIGIAAGITCRFCERTDCNQRAAPSYKFAFSADENVKKDNFFSPILDGEGAKKGR